MKIVFGFLGGLIIGASSIVLIFSFIESTDNDYFAKKQECLSYKDYAEEEFVSMNTSTNVSLLDEIFYSPELDTCIAVVYENHFDSDYMEGNWTRNNYWDILTLESIDVFLIGTGSTELYDYVFEEKQREKDFRKLIL